MNPHDIIEVHDCSVVCRCGVTFTGSSLERAQENHGRHHGLMQARAALEEATDGP